MARYRAGHRVEGLRWKDRCRGQDAQARHRRLSMMHGPLPDQNDHSDIATSNALVAALQRGLAFCKSIIVVVAGGALVAGCIIPKYTVFGRAPFSSPHYFAEEAGVVFSVRAHSSIEP